MKRHVFGFLSLFILLAGLAAEADPVAVRFPEGSTHGFLALRSVGGETLASGELVQSVKSERVDSRLTFRFKDGSLYDETVVFSQQRVFRLLSYRLVQRGPSFPSSEEVTFDATSGAYKIRLREKPTSKEEVTEGRMELPADVHNGMTATILKNLPAGAAGQGHIVAFLPKPSLLKTELVSEGEDQFFVGDTARKARRYLIKLELGGLKGAVASILGQEPPELRYWISAGSAPAFVKFEGAMFFKGPVWRIELSAPRWPKSNASGR